MNNDSIIGRVHCPKCGYEYTLTPDGCPHCAARSNTKKGKKEKVVGSVTIPPPSPSPNLTHDKLFRGEMTEKAQASMVTDEEIDLLFAKHCNYKTMAMTNDDIIPVMSRGAFVNAVRDLLKTKEAK